MRCQLNWVNRIRRVVHEGDCSVSTYADAFANRRSNSGSGIFASCCHWDDSFFEIWSEASVGVLSKTGTVFVPVLPS
jgi:hypothetical protein